MVGIWGLGISEIREDESLIREGRGANIIYFHRNGVGWLCGGEQIVLQGMRLTRQHPRV